MNFNIVDYIIVGIIGISALWGLYRGFLQSFLSTGASLLSFIASFFFYPFIAEKIQQNNEIISRLIHYTDATSRIKDLELSRTPIKDLVSDSLESILQNANLPHPIDKIFSSNISNQIYSPSGASNVSDYLSNTLVSVGINIVSFLICFLAIYLIMAFIINMLRVVFNFPLLKNFDWFLGAAFGIVRGTVFCFLVFALVPLITSIIRIEQVDTLLSESVLAQYFNSGNIILSILNKRF